MGRRGFDCFNEVYKIRFSLKTNYGYTEIGELNRNDQKEIAEIKYTATGKVKEVIRIANSSKKNLKFDYDAMGNRIAKHIYSSTNVWEYSEYYIKDAQGNTMSVYKYQNDPGKFQESTKKGLTIYRKKGLGTGK